MKIALLIVSLFPVLAWGEPYAIFQAQGLAGRHGLEDSESLMINSGIGYEVNGFYVEWDAGINAEMLFDDLFNIDENQQKGQMTLTTGYFMKVSGNNYVKIGAGSKAAIFDEKCYYDYRVERICVRREEYGPAYKLGYFHRVVGEGYIGLDLSSDELSSVRKYGALTLTINSFF